MDAHRYHETDKLIAHLEAFIEAVVTNRTSDHIQDAVRLNEVRQELKDFLLESTALA